MNKKNILQFADAIEDGKESVKEKARLNKISHFLVARVVDPDPTLEKK